MHQKGLQEGREEAIDAERQMNLFRQLNALHGRELS
jgi:hypothetical protein